MKRFSESELVEIQSSLEPWLSSQPGVTGSSVALGRDGSPVLRIYTHRITPAVRQAIQRRVPEVRLDWDEGDEFVPQ